MNRVLSIESSRGCSGDSAFITKRLCISVLLSIGFLSFIGGFIFGRLTGEKECHKNAATATVTVFPGSQNKKLEIDALVSSIDELIRVTRNSSERLHGERLQYDEFRRLLICDRLSGVASDHPGAVDYTSDIITAKLQILAQCLDDASALVKKLPSLIGINTSILNIIANQNDSQLNNSRQINDKLNR